MVLEQLRLTRERIDEEKGFTLSELLVALLIGGLLMSAVALIVRSTTSSYLTNRALSEMQEEGRRAASLMVSEIREAFSIDPTMSNESTILVFGDFDGNGDLDGHLWGIDEEGNLVCSFIDEDKFSPVAEGVLSMSLTYWGVDENTGQLQALSLSSPGWHLRVKRVDIALTLIREPLGTRLEEAVEDSAFVRNDLGITWYKHSP